MTASKSIKKNSITIILSLILALVLVISNFSNILGTIKANKVFAKSEISEVSITNANFDKDVVSDKIVSPTGWTKLNSSSITTLGIISINQEIFEKQKEDNYKLTTKPYSYDGLTDEQVLMINAQDNLLNMGFQSPNFTLSSNSYYVISFKAYTEKSTSSVIASAKLSGNETLDETYVSIVTNGNWKDYYFFVETSDLSNVEAKLELWLGFSNGVKSYGAVFFDNIKIYEVSQKTFGYMYNNVNHNFASTCSLKSTLSANQVDNYSFENSPLGWTMLTNSLSTPTNENNYSGVINFNLDNYEQLYKLENKVYDANLIDNTKALLINNVQANSIGYKSSSITINQHKIYKITVLAKTSIQEGKATLVLKENDPYGGLYDSFEPKTFTLETTTSEEDNKKTNGWVEYTFYVKGRSFENTSVNLELWLGYDELAKGYAMFDYVRVYEISSNDYDTNSTKSNSSKADFTSSKTQTIANGNFNLVKIDSPVQNFPYAPTDWKSTILLNKDVKSGVINTSDTSMIAGLINPTSGNKYTNNNNILMIGNVGENAQTYTPENTFNLASNSCYKLSFKVKTQALQNGATAGFKLYTDILTLKEIMYIESNEWTTYTIYIKTGINSFDAKIDLSLGQKHNGSGFAFFDDITINSISNEEYSEISSEKIKLDYSSDNFTNTNEKSIDGLFSSLSYSKNTDSSTNILYVTAGVVDVLSENAMSGKLTGMENPFLPENVSGNVLLIKSIEDTNYSFKSNEKYTLSSGDNAYYKVSVWVRTKGLAQQQENAKQDTNKVNYPFGATITLTSINKSFTGINTNNEWKQYSFYINATDNAEIQIVLGLGNSNALTSGTVFFSGVKVEKIEQSDYYTNIQPLETNSSIDNIMAVGSTKQETASEDEGTPSASQETFNWLLIPSLISAVALVVAILAVGIKTFSKKHPKKVKIEKGEYTREKAFNKKKDIKERIKKINSSKENLERKLEIVKIDLVNNSITKDKEQQKFEKRLKQEINTNYADKTQEEIENFKTSQKENFENEVMKSLEIENKKLTQEKENLENNLKQLVEEKKQLKSLDKEQKLG